MNAYRKDDPQAEQIEQLDDLTSQGEEVQDAEQVKGGFNPQPEPPGGIPVFGLPVFNPGGLVR